MANTVDYRKVKKQEYDGRTFDSKAELQMYLYLKAAEGAGDITGIEHQVSVELLPGPRGMQRKFRVDFSAVELKTGSRIYYEVKGFQTDRWQANLMLWRHFGPGKLIIVRVGWGKLYFDEEVIPDSKYILEKLTK